MEEKDRQLLQELYQKISEIEEIYVVPKSIYNQIMKKIGHLEDYLKDARKSRDRWRKKYQDCMAEKKTAYERSKEAIKELKKYRP